MNHTEAFITFILLKALESITYNTQLPEERKDQANDPILITKQIRISQTSRNGSVLIITDSEKQETNINSQLIKAIVRSHYWNNLLLSGEAKTTTDIQQAEKLKTNRYVKKVINLKFLSPPIIEKLLTGMHRRDLVVEDLFKVNTLNWNEQCNLLNL